MKSQLILFVATQLFRICNRDRKCTINKFRFCTTHLTVSLKYLYMKIFENQIVSQGSSIGVHTKVWWVRVFIKKFDSCWYVIERRTKGYHIERRRRN